MKKSLFLCSFALVSVFLGATPRAARAFDAGYEKGLYLQTDDKNYRFKFNIQMQPQHEYVSKEAALDQSSFKLARVRTYFTGNVFSPKFKYALTIEYSGDATKPDIRDGQIDLNLASFFKIRAGRFFIPINREDMYAGTGLQLVNESIVAFHFAVYRDLGVQFSGDIVKSLNYALLVTNGDGGKNSADTGKGKNKEPQVGGRLEWNILGKSFGYQGDLMRSESPNIQVGATVLYDFGAADETDEFQSFIEQQIQPSQVKLTRGDVDGTFTWMGASLIGQFQFAYNNLYRAFDKGYLAQVGYFIIPKKMEIAGRYAVVHPDFPFPALAKTGLTKDNAGSGIPLYEMTGGLSYYIRDHDLKVQMDYSQLLNVGGVRNLNDQRIRTQITLVF